MTETARGEIGVRLSCGIQISRKEFGSVLLTAGDYFIGRSSLNTLKDYKLLREYGTSLP